MRTKSLRLNSVRQGLLSEYFPLFMLLFFSVTAATAPLSGAVFLGLAPNLGLILTWGFIVFGVYGINRYTDIEDHLNDTGKRDFFLANRFYFYLSVCFLAVSAIWLLVTGLITIYHVLSVYGGIAYSVPLFPWIAGKGKIRWLRLKEVPFLKSLLVSGIMGTSFFAFYLKESFSNIRAAEIILLMVAGSLSLFVNTVFCDIRDVVGDKAANIRTIPVLLGLKGTFLGCILFPSTILLIIAGLFHVLSLVSAPVAVLLYCTIGYPALYIYLYYKERFPRNLTFLIADSCVPLFALGLIIIGILRA